MRIRRRVGENNGEWVVNALWYVEVELGSVEADAGGRNTLEWRSRLPRRVVESGQVPALTFAV